MTKAYSNAGELLTGQKLNRAIAEDYKLKHKDPNNEWNTHNLKFSSFQIRRQHIINTALLVKTNKAGGWDHLSPNFFKIHN